MTWDGMSRPMHRGVACWAPSLAWLLVLAGCGGGAQRSKNLEVTDPMANAELSDADDVDLETPGLQYDVIVQSDGLEIGADVQLLIGGEPQRTAKVATGGRVTFTTTTMPPGQKRIQARTPDLAVASDDNQSYIYRLLDIIAPSPGPVEDADPGADGVQVNVTVMAYGVVSNVELSVDGEAVGSAAPDGNEQVSFMVTLAEGDSTLVASTEGGLSSDPVEVSVGGDVAGCDVQLVLPKLDDDGTATLGGDALCADDVVTTQVQVSTGVGDGRSVVLRNLAGMSLSSTTVDGTVATFDGVALSMRETGLVFETADGECMVDLEATIIRDCDRPDCNITGPVPVDFVSGGELTKYVNGSMVDDEGRLTVEVSSPDGVEVFLNVENAGGSVNRLVGAPGANGIASFDVLVSEGAYRVWAECTDAGGNGFPTPDENWVVDTTACGVDITSPVDDALLTPKDFDGMDGDDVVLAASVSGDDCVGFRVATCDPGQGISENVDFVDWDGRTTFDPDLMAGGMLTQCLEISDQAGNVGLDSLPVIYLAAPPTVRMLTPLSGPLRVNLDGGAGYEVTASGEEGACTFDFRVECSEIGGSVELYRVGELDPIAGAVADCVEPQAGDTDVTPGFGIATFENQVFQDGVQGSEVSVYARQTVEGAFTSSSGDTMMDAVSLAGDCRRPRYQLAGDCDFNGEPVLIGGLGIDHVVTVTATLVTEQSRPDQITFALTSVGDNIPVGGTSYDAVSIGNAYSRDDVALGQGADTIEVRISEPDTFGNAPLPDVPGKTLCTFQIVEDPPSLAALMVANGAGPWGPNDNDVCPSSPGGDYRVPVMVTVDQTNNRVLEYEIDDDGTRLALSGIMSLTGTYCVPVPADRQDHSVRIHLVSGGGVSVSKLAPNPVNASSFELSSALAVYQASDCDPGVALQPDELAVEVTVAADERHVGQTASFMGRYAAGTDTVSCVGSDCTASACVIGGVPTQDMTVTLDGGMRTLNVAIVPAPPQSAISLMPVRLPADDLSYRDGVSFEWPAPTDALAGYELLCADEDLGDLGDANAWLAKATTYTIDAVPPATTGLSPLRIGMTHHCVLRGIDYADDRTPMPADSEPVPYHFRRLDIPGAGADLKFGRMLRSAGDLDGDGHDDLLIGADSRAYVYYGVGDGNLATGVGMTFTATDATFGNVVAAIGDYNADTFNDLLITDYYNGTSYNGTAYVVFGGPQRLTGSREIALTGSTGTYACTGADICYAHADTLSLLGWSGGSAGDFDGDGVLDLALGATLVGGGPFLGRTYVLEGGATVCESPPCAIEVDGAGATGFYVEGVETVEQVGLSFAAMGDLDGALGDELVLSARGGTNSATLLYLQGRAFGAGMQQITLDMLDEIATGNINSLGLRLGVASNIIDDGEVGVPDLLVSDYKSTPGRVLIYPGDLAGGFRLNGDRSVAITGLASNVDSDGHHIGTGLTPYGGISGDLDGDGLQELVIGDTSVGAGRAVLFYGHELNAACDGCSSLQAADVGRTLQAIDDVNAPVPATVDGYVVEIAGDLNGDGEPDYVLADPLSDVGGVDSGRVSILY